MDGCPQQISILWLWAALSCLAPSEAEPITTKTDRAAAIEHLVIGTLLYEPLPATIRRMAHESQSART
jgi:hypothetical protein